MSTLLLNTLTGKTSAGSIVVTGEGGSTTTNLQQGLNKMWCNQDNGTTINQSLNLGSLTDNGTGDYTHNYTNNFGNVHYAGSGTLNTGSTYSNIIVVKSDAHAVGSIQLLCGNVNANGETFTKTDFADVMYHISGDLA